MGAPLNAAAAAFALMCSATACEALGILDTIDDWSFSPKSERVTIARTLALVAGQGRADLDTEFFLRCMEDAASGASPLSARKINEVAAGCVLFRLTVFCESD